MNTELLTASRTDRSQNTPNRSAMIRLHNVEKVYRTDRIETLALSNIQLEVKRGEFLSIMGPSGSGKSTLLNMIGLLDRPSSGEIEVDGVSVAKKSDGHLARIRGETIGFIFQSFHLIRDLKVLDNVEIPLIYQSVSGAERRRRAEEALDRVGLSARISHFPDQLSGGQQQRVAIARAIVSRPKLLLADEPTGNLDSQMGGEIMEVLEEFHREGTTLVMVTHDEALAERTERIVRVFDGRQVH